MSEKPFSPVLLIFCAFLITIAPSVNAQVPVEISKEKIVSEGKVYYIHHVLKGQTLFSLSKAYKVPIDVIQAENNIVMNDIKEGQVLKIPASVATTSTVTPAGTGTNSSTGIPKTEQTELQDKNRDYTYHKVVAGETLSSLSRKYGVTVRELKKANKGLLYPREGEYLMIPLKRNVYAPVQKEPVEDLAALEDEMPDTVAVVSDEDSDSFRVVTEKTVLKELHGSVNVAVLLPFFLEENNRRSYIDSTQTDTKGRRIYKEVNMPADWIYEGSIPFVELYEGILIAVDSLRALGLRVRLDVFDTGADTNMINRLIYSDRLRNADLIIGPVFSDNLMRVADFAAEENIPVVSPVPLRNDNILDSCRTLFRLSPSREAVQDVMVKEVSSYKESNIVFVYSDSLMYDPRSYNFWKKLISMSRDSASDSSMISTCYYSGVTNGRTVSSTNVFEDYLKTDTTNLIVLATTSTPIVSSALSSLHALSRKYDIKVIGYPDIGAISTLDLRYFYDLGITIPSENYLDFTLASTTEFLKSYYRKFNTEPTSASFAWRGFDLAFFFIAGIASEGKSFLKHPERFNPQLLTYDPDFRRVTNNSGYDNLGIYMIKYKKNMSVSVSLPAKEITPAPALPRFTFLLPE